MPEYIKNPDLPVIKEGFKGNPIFNGEFANNGTPDTPVPFRKILKWKYFDSNPQSEEKKKEEFSIPVAEKDIRFLTSAEDGIMWLGHASFLIRIGGITFITDPIIQSITFVKRRSPFPLHESDLSNLIDYLLFSHGHYDHFDRFTIIKLSQLNPEARALMPLRMGKIMPKGAQNIQLQEAAWWQQYHIEKGVEVYFTPAKHWYRRGIKDYNKVLWGSYYIKKGNKSIYFAGDSAYSDHFKDIKDTLGAPDICLMPIGAYKPQYIMKEAHMTPTEATQAFHDMEGKIFIPMHYGTFDLADEPLGEPPAMMNDLKRSGKLNGELKILELGEVFRF